MTESSGEFTASDGRIAAHRRMRVGEWLAALTVLLSVLGMAMSSPALVGPDEAAHQATASYTTVHVLPPKSETRDYIAGILKLDACMAGDSTKDASCEPGRDDISPGKVRLFNYPPPYYWAVGLGQKFAPEADRWMDVGGRLASLVLNVAGLALLAALLRRRHRAWGTYLLLVSPPMAAFLWAVVNASGWEITAGLLFAYVFGAVWWGLESSRRWPNSAQESGRPVHWLAVLGVAATAVAFGLSRHDAILWMVLLVASVLLMARTPLSRASQAKILLAAGAGLASGLVWQLLFPAQHVLNNPDRVENPVLLDYLHWFSQIDEFLPTRLRQMVGVLGWLDTPVPQILLLAVLVGWAAFIGFVYARTRIPALALLIGFVGTFIVPSAFEVLRWNDWPYWYQGRITLPFTLAFLLLLLVRFAGPSHRAAILLSLLNSFVLGFMVWQNLMRYAFGVRDYIPLRWSDPAIGAPWFWGTLVAIAAIAVIAVVRAAMLWSERPHMPWLPSAESSKGQTP